jgi:hypothetical protein
MPEGTYQVVVILNMTLSCQAGTNSVAFWAKKEPHLMIQQPIRNLPCFEIVVILTVRISC